MDGLEHGVETEVKASIPILASGRVKASLKLSIPSTYKINVEIWKLKSILFSFLLPYVPINTYVKISAATIFQGNIDVNYKGQMRYILDSKKGFKYDVNGTYNGVAVYQAVVSVEPKKYWNKNPSGSHIKGINIWAVACH